MKQHICVWWVNSTVYIFVWTVPLPLTWMKWYDQVFIWRVSVSIWVCLWLNNPTSTHHWRCPYLEKCPALRTPPPSSPCSPAFGCSPRRSSIHSARSWLRWRLRSDSRTGSRWTATEEARPPSCTPNTPWTSPAAGQIHTRWENAVYLLYKWPTILYSRGAFYKTDPKHSEYVDRQTK